MNPRRPVERRLVEVLANTATALVVAAAGAQAPSPDAGVPAPLVPGFERLEGHASAVERGQLLLGELMCTACHAPHEVEARALTSRRAPDLTRVGARVSAQYLLRFLRDPHRTEPGTRMPALVADADVEPLVHHLVSRGGPIAPARRGGSDAQVERGRELFHRIGCAACHPPEAVEPGAPAMTSVPLGDLAAKTTIDELARFLLDPSLARPDGRMPDLRLAEEEAQAIAVYLLRAQLDNPQSLAAAEPSQPGVAYAYYEHDCGDALDDLQALEPTARGVAAAFTLDVPERVANDRGEEFALRFEAALEVPRNGEYTFYTRSDDGSRLWVDGEMVVDNDGLHGTREREGTIALSAGEHAIAVSFFEHHGGQALEVLWKGPGIERQPIPSERLFAKGGRPMVPLGTVSFTVDRDKARHGAERYRALGCAACHEPDSDAAGSDPAENDAAPASTPARATPLAALDRDAVDGCLSDAPAATAARYALSRAQREALRAALADRAWRADEPQPEQRVQKLLASHDCYACHERGGAGGPEEGRYDLFETRVEIDLGDEGRFPPPLDGVGSKLRESALEQLLVEGRHHVRGRFMATRMPGFLAAPMRELVAALVAADQQPGDTRPPEFSEEAVAVGRRMVGARGFACITCHDVAGNKGIGIPGIDIATAHARLNPGWFRRFVLNPAAVKPGTRMPAFWAGARSPFRDVLDGDSGRQVDAVWTYLSLGASIPAPLGVTPPDTDAAMELTPIEEPIVHRTFMTDVGPRTILAGFPERVHVAFDAHVVRLAKAWRGRFFDQSGVASGRTDKFLGPLGEDVLDVPGPAFARLAASDAPWPTFGKRDRDVGGRFSGYRLDAERRPVFRYAIDATARSRVEVEEQPLPVLRPGGTVLKRVFRLSAQQPPDDLWFLAWAGERIERVGASWRVDDRVTVDLYSTFSIAPRVRDAGGGRKELVVPIRFDRPEIQFEEVVRW